MIVLDNINHVGVNSSSKGNQKSSIIMAIRLS